MVNDSCHLLLVQASLVVLHRKSYKHVVIFLRSREAKNETFPSGVDHGTPPGDTKHTFILAPSLFSWINLAPSLFTWIKQKKYMKYASVLVKYENPTEKISEVLIL